LKQFHDLTPGAFIVLGNPEEINPTTLLKEKFRFSGFPVCLADNFKHIWDKTVQDSTLLLEEELKIFW
jgi:hypothetical protein